MRVLLVYEEIPEQTTFRIIDNPDPSLLDLLEACNGKVVNSDEYTPEMEALSDALSSKKENCVNPEHPLACSIKDVHDIIPGGAFDRAFSFGMVC